MPAIKTDRAWCQTVELSKELRERVTAVVLEAWRSSSHDRDALAYAQLGWRVHPCYWIRPDGSCCLLREPCSSPGKHPILKAWHHRRPPIRTLIERWWGRSPQPTSRSPPDPAADLCARCRRHRRRALPGRPGAPHGPLPELYPQQWTGGGRGGWQAFLAWPAGLKSPTAPASSAQARYSRRRGYVAGPPSRRSSPMPGRRPLPWVCRRTCAQLAGRAPRPATSARAGSAAPGQRILYQPARGSAYAVKALRTSWPWSPSHLRTPQRAAQCAASSLSPRLDGQLDRDIVERGLADAA